MLDKIKKLFFVSRPISWLNTAYPFAAGYMLAGGKIDVMFVVATLFFLGPYNLLMYGINDVFDYESDIRNPRKGGIEGMKEQRSLHPAIIKSVIFVNLLFLPPLVLLGDLVSSLVLLAVNFLVLAYSISGLRFKEIPLVDSITSSLHFVGPLLFALALHGFPTLAWPYVVAFLLWGVASHAFGAVQDIVPDRKGNISSIATFFGAQLTMRFAFGLYIVAAVLTIAQPMPFAIVGVVGLVYAANIYRYLNVSDKNSSRANAAWRRFIWLNYLTGFILTLVIIVDNLSGLGF